LRAGATVDAKDSAGDTALHWAAAENTNVEIISCLLEAGADVNATDKYGWLPIHTAAERNSNPDVIETLLGAGAERDRRAYFVLFRPRFLLKHNSSMSDKDKRVALALLDEPD
jgi:ankyrin repeat protein